MKRFLKRTLLIATLLSTLTASTFSVSAVNLKDIFNAQYYAGQYEDLQNAYGNNTNALYQHYLKFGMSEGRSASPILDVVAYRNTYKDLDAAFGDNWDAYVNHYYTYGIKENRDNGRGFNPIAYAEKYPDIKAAFGDDYAAIINHYLTYGIAEGRTCDAPVSTSSTSSSSSSSDYTDSEDTGNDNVGDDNTGNVPQTTFMSYMQNGMSFTDISCGTRINDSRTLSEIMAANLSNVIAVDTNGSYDVDITWTCDSFDKDTAGIYWVIGTVTPADGRTVDYTLPKITASLTLSTTDTGFYDYYTFGDIGDEQNTNGAIKLTDYTGFSTSVNKGSDWTTVLVKLDTQVDISAFDGQLLRPVDIAWSCDNYNGDVSGTYIATGVVTCEAITAALPEITATITVTEQESTGTMLFYCYSFYNTTERPSPHTNSLEDLPDNVEPGYYVTLNRSVGQTEIPPLTISVFGKNSETDEIQAYEVDVTVDTTNYTPEIAGTYYLLANNIESTTPGFEIPFELPNFYIISTVR